jgi:myxalamid-type polyketide synthase MxaE and MxaD
VYDSNPLAAGKAVTRWGSYLEEVQGFDWRFFGVSPREACSIDPQHRVLLEVAWEALEDAGMPASRVSGCRAGVFVGAMFNDYGRVRGGDLTLIDGYTSQNNTFAYAANRISYFFDLRGPSMALDTNCSGSLLAVHQACWSVWTGESEWALAGGVSLILSPDTDISMSKAGALSPTGRSRTWDAKADGFVRGEGAGLVVLKPLSRAQADGDRIYCVVRGTSTNHTGRGHWIVEPSSAAQRQAIEGACRMAGVRPSELDYVELHGTGTPKGDPVEAEGLGSVMADRSSSQPCRVGSIKTNFGHLDAAAGIAGFIKTALCVHHRELVPSLHFEQCNPAIELERLKLRVQTHGEPWPQTGRLPLAGVTAIGFGGTNVHVVVQGVEPEASAWPAPAEASSVLALSARSEASRRSMALAVAERLERPGASVRDAGYTLGARRAHHEWRVAVVGATAQDLAQQLRRWAQGESSTAREGRASVRTPRLVFVFPGHGPQWLGMVRDQVGTATALGAKLAECDALVRREVGWSVVEQLRATASESRLDEPQVVQPVLFSVAVALAAQWRAWGLQPDAVVGHSFGELAAAVVAGALSLPDAVHVVCARGRVTQRRAGHGGVAVVELGAALIERLLVEYDGLEVAGVNSPTTTVVTGPLAPLESLLVRLELEGVFARRVPLGYASHGRDMDSVLDEFMLQIAHVKGRATAIDFVSTVEGCRVGGEVLDAEYWVQNLRRPVRFASAVQAAAEPSGRETVFLEISPHPVLMSAVRQTLAGRSDLRAVLGSLVRHKASAASLDEALASVYAAGLEPDFAARYPRAKLAPAPSYPWDRERMWLQEPSNDRSGSGTRPVSARHHPLLGAPVEAPDRHTFVWEQTLGGDDTAYFVDHGLQGIPSVSTSGMVEMIVTAASQKLGTEALELVDVELRRAFLLPLSGGYRVQTVLRRGEEWTAEVRGRAEGVDGGWRTHATARVRLAAATPPDAPRFERPLRDRLATDAAYGELADRGLQYGPTFRGIEWLSREGDGVLACVRMPDGLDADPYFFHPAFHDAAMHAAVLAEPCRGHTGILPVRIRRIWIHARPSAVLRSHVRVTPIEGGMRADLRVETADGVLVEIAEGIELAHLDDALVRAESEEEGWLYDVAWTELPPVVAASRPVEARAGKGPPVWVVLSDRAGVGDALARCMRAGGFEAILVTQSSAVAPGGDPEGAVRAVAASLPRGAAIAGAVHLWSLDLPAVDAVEIGQLDTVMRDGCDSALHLLRALDETAPAAASPVWFVTRGAQPHALEAAQMAPLQAPLWGLARAAAAELPSRWGGLADLDPSADAEGSAARLWSWLCGVRAGEDEVLFRGDKIYGGRLVRRPPAATRAHAGFRDDATYLVTGGTGGLGLEVARWLAARGARHLLLAARTPIPPRADWSTIPPDAPGFDIVRAVEAMEAAGAAVDVASVDVADPEGIALCLREREDRGRPAVRGLFHLAGTVHIEDMLRVGTSSLIDALRPKVHGTLALHRALPDIDAFVLFSSASAVIRSPRLGHYAAGNAFLDAMAHYRHAQGRAAATIDWGLWSDVGFIRRLEQGGPSAMRSMKSIAPQTGVRILEHLTAIDAVQTVVWPPDWDEWARQHPGQARSSFVAHLVSTAPAAADPARPSIRDSLLEMGSAERPAALLGHLGREIAGVLGLALAEPSFDVPLEQLGFDSLQATELQARLSQDLGVHIPVLRLLGFSTVRTIASEVTTRLGMPGYGGKGEGFDGQKPSRWAGKADRDSHSSLLDADGLARASGDEEG